MAQLYSILKASKLGAGAASDMYTALLAQKINKGGSGGEAELSGVPPLTFPADGTPLIDYLISGNMIQSGTPTRENPIMPEGCGERTGNLFSGEFSQFDNVGGTGDIYTYFYIPEDFTLTLIAKDTHTVPESIFIGITKDGGQSQGGYEWAISQRKNVTEGDILTVKSSTSGYHFISMYRKITAVLNWILDHYYIMLNLGSTALPYEPYGYKLDISSGGENLCLVSQNNSVTYSTFNNYIISNNTVTSTGQALLGFKCKVEPNTSYTISIKKNTSADLRIREYSSEPSDWQTGFIIQSLNTNQTTAVITTTQDTKWILVAFWFSAEGHTVSDIMLNLGSTPLPYEPYNRIRTPIFLGEVPTTRLIKKLVLTGEETFEYVPSGNINRFRMALASNAAITDIVSTHYKYEFSNVYGNAFVNSTLNTITICDDYSSETDFKAYLQQQYATGTPITVWYVLAESETGIVNEPLRKIGDYADTLSMEQASVQIPTNRGNTVIDVLTELKPSEVYIKYHTR